MTRSPAGVDASGALTRYVHRSRQPVHIMLMVLPLVLLYEIGVERYLIDEQAGQMVVVRAWRMLQDFFASFGAVGQRIPAITLLAILTTQLVLTRPRGPVRPTTIPAMALESALWAVPLLVVSSLLGLLFGGASAPAAAGEAVVHMSPTGSSWQARATIAIGAGVYEEMLFRLALMPMIHLVLTDLLRIPSRAGVAAALVASAVGFALYHDVWPSHRLDLQRLAFLTIAGVWFGIAYLCRGFGIAVGAHVAYDLAVMLPPASQIDLADL